MLRLRKSPKFSLVPALAALAMLALTVSLGNWQSGRAKEKDVLEARQAQGRQTGDLVLTAAPVAAEAADGRKVVARGSFLPALTVYWDNQIVDHVPGYAIIVPFKLAGSDKVVLVDRGLAPTRGNRAVLPVIPAPAGEVEVQGRAYLPPRRTLELKASTEQPQVMENVTPQKVGQLFKLDVHDFLLRESGAAPAGVLRMADNGGSARGDTGMTAARHRGYAFQWYALAGLTVLLFLLFTFLTNDDAARDA